jgi:hypothetical protein
MARRAVTDKQLFKVEGLEDVLAAVGRVKVGTAKELKKVFIRAGMVIATDAQRNVDKIPDSALNASGKQKLKQMIIAAYGDPRKSNAIVGASAVRARKLNKGERYMNPYWWEFGTAMRTTKGGAGRGKITATPFFRPAVTANKSKVRDVLAEGILATIEGLADNSK